MFLYQTPRTTVVRKRSPNTTNSARTEEVFENLINSAIPANPKSIFRILKSLEDERTFGSLARDQIIKEVISDPGLAYYYLSNIRSNLNLEILPEDPLSPIKTMTTGELKHFFDVPASQISKFRVSAAGPPQLLRLQHTYIASKSASNLSRQFDLDEGKAFSLVHVTQAALNLLAWSYPTLFDKALFNKRRFKASIEESLNNLVGVKTENITNKLAKKIGLPTSLLMDLQVAQKTNSGRLYSLESKPSILTIAQLGDLLAKANDREHFPEALAEWDRVESQILSLGLDSPTQEIHDEIKTFISELGGTHHIPYQMAIFKTQHLKSELAPAIEADPGSCNPYYNKIQDRFKAAISDVYKKVIRDNPSQEALAIFVNQLIPELNVHNGCLYLVKPDGKSIKSCLTFGKVKKDRPEISVLSQHPIPQSLYSSFPQQFENENKLITICGALPHCKKEAVLILEFEAEAYAQLGDKSFAIFNAIATTLVDAMGQRSQN